MEAEQVGSAARTSDERDVVKAVALLDEASFLLGVNPDGWEVLHALLILRKNCWNDVAKHTGIDKTLISRWCTGNIGAPQKKNLQKIADFFRIPMDTLRRIMEREKS